MLTVSRPQKVRISALLPESLVKEAKHVSSQRGEAFGVLLENILQEWLIKRLEREAEELSKMDFPDLPSEDEWLSLAPKI